MSELTRGTRIDPLFTMSDNLHPRRAFWPRRGRENQIFADEPGDPAGGARRDRTDDLLLAKQALSQLSYGPVRGQRTDDGGQINRISVVCRLYSVV